MRGGSDDPRIAQIKEILTRKPDFTRHEIYLSLGVANKTLDRWIQLGWVPHIKKKTPTENSPWRRKL